MYFFNPIIWDHRSIPGAKMHFLHFLEDNVGLSITG